MPVRIKPTRDLGRCTLNIKSIENIIERLKKDFHDITCNASDGVWELYDEQPEILLNHLCQRDRLDTLTFHAKNHDSTHWINRANAEAFRQENEDPIHKEEAEELNKRLNQRPPELGLIEEQFSLEELPPTDAKEERRFWLTRIRAAQHRRDQ